MVRHAVDVEREAAKAGLRNRQHLLVVEAHRELGVVAHVLDRLVDLDPEHVVRGRRLGNHDVAQSLAVALHAVGDLPENAPALLARHARPRTVVEGRAGDRDRLAHVFERRLRSRSDRLLGCRIRNRIRATVACADPFPANVHPVIHPDAPGSPLRASRVARCVQSGLRADRAFCKTYTSVQNLRRRHPRCPAKHRRRVTGGNGTQSAEVRPP